LLLAEKLNSCSQHIVGTRAARHMMSPMKPMSHIVAVVSAILVCASLFAHGQQCPGENTSGSGQQQETIALKGKLIYHDGMRKWFELKLDRPVCGQPSVELFPGRNVFYPGRPDGLETFRGCRVRTEGSLGGPASGYYTLNVNQGVGEIEPIGKCTRQPPLPDYSKAKPDKSIRKFRVEMMIDFEQTDRPIFLRVTSEGKELRPWQAYASYFLTGGYVLYGHCADGFIVDRVFGDPVLSPQHLEARGDPYDAAFFDPSSPDDQGYKKKLQLGFTCVRAQ